MNVFPKTYTVLELRQMAKVRGAKTRQEEDMFVDGYLDSRKQLVDHINDEISTEIRERLEGGFYIQ